MTKEIYIYTEGGGNGKQTQAAFGKGMSTFLAELLRLAKSKGGRCRVVVSGARSAAYDDFRKALRSHPDAFNVLLVDSEASVSTPPWQHLRQRDNWGPIGTTDEHCHLMAQAMEAWFMADKDAVKEYFGQGFQESALPQNPLVELIPKDDLKPKLDHACRNTKKKEYKEIRDGSRLLQRIDPVKVRAAAPHCDRLFKTLATKMGGTS